MNWKERVAPGVAIMRSKTDRITGLHLSPITAKVLADTIERMADELDNARQTILAFAVFGIVLAISAIGYAWRVS